MIALSVQEDGQPFPCVYTGDAADGVTPASVTQVVESQTHVVKYEPGSLRFLKQESL